MAFGAPAPQWISLKAARLVRGETEIEEKNEERRMKLGMIRTERIEVEGGRKDGEWRNGRKYK